MAAKTRRHLTDEQRAERRAQDRDRLEQAARQLLSSDGWQRWVRVRARNGLARYSLGNQLLIAMQAPDATFVAGFHAWKDLGRRVRKGEHGIRILAPMPLRERETIKTPMARTKTTAAYGRCSSPSPSSTSHRPNNPRPTGSAGRSRPRADHRRLARASTHAARELRGRAWLQRAPTPLEGPDRRVVRQSQMEIVVNERIAAERQVRVLVHEIAHALGIGYADRGRARAEVMVDCVTYIVCGQVGLDTGGEPSRMSPGGATGCA